MSEGKEKEVEVKEDEGEEKKADIVETNVALLKAELLRKDKLVEGLTVQLDAMTNKYNQARDLIEQDSKAALVAEIAPKTTVPDHVLAAMDVETLLDYKKILDSAKVPAFKSGTPLITDKDSPHAKLANMYEDYKAKTWGKN